MYTYHYPRPGLTCDAVVFGFDGNKLSILLIQRADDPYKGKWALPGGFVDQGETAEEAVLRELGEETALHVAGLEQVFTATKPGRDPRGWTVSVIFTGFAHSDNMAVSPGDDAKLARWFEYDRMPELAFDHREIIESVRNYIRNIFLFRFPDCCILPQQFEIDWLKRLTFLITEDERLGNYLVRKWKDSRIIKPDKTSKLYIFDEKVMERIRRTGFVEKNHQ